MGNDRWHSACKAYHYLVRNSRTDLTQQNVQLAQLYLANGSLDTFTYETLAACELSYISLSGTNPRKGLFGLPVTVAMRDSLNAPSTGNILRRLVLGSQPVMQRALCKANGPKD